MCVCVCVEGERMIRRYIYALGDMYILTLARSIRTKHQNNEPP